MQLLAAAGDFGPRESLIFLSSSFPRFWDFVDSSSKLSLPRASLPSSPRSRFFSLSSTFVASSHAQTRAHAPVFEAAAAAPPFREARGAARPHGQRLARARRAGRAPGAPCPSCRGDGSGPGRARGGRRSGRDAPLRRAAAAPLAAVGKMQQRLRRRTQREAAETMRTMQTMVRTGCHAGAVAVAGTVTRHRRRRRHRQR